MPTIPVRSIATAALLLVLLLGAAAGVAQEGPTLLVQGGLYDVFQEEEATEVGLEYTFLPGSLGVSPAIGASYTSDGTFLAYAGLRREFDLGPDWILTPSFAFAYWQQGDGKDLGLALEFRSALELAWRATRRDRLGLTVYHVSNAGIDDKNPGANALLLGWRRVLVR